ncbi:hypothetical protein [Sphingomonas aerolata]|uniref:hypothetical protein n=1 Tax=Sphingomonas aerolata TaxID=185951 RepID=UPI00208E42A3|nr:hypothetical protein [Sphingomonas aerolata]USR00339.1 hypothetical protein NEF64_00245 [Sphingomonas aerolata]
MITPRSGAVATETFVIGDVEPSIRIAFPTTADAPTLGLDQPTRLSGGAALTPDALSSATGLDHVLGLRSFLAEACRSQAAAGRSWFRHPPLVLVGAAGFGRGHVARRIAHLTGVPLVEACGSELNDAGEREGRSTRGIPIPVLAMALTRCANPIVLLDLGEKPLDPLASRRLVEMLDPVRTGRWLDEGLGCVFDLSNVSWIVQASETSHSIAAIEAHGGRAIATVRCADTREELRRLSIAQQVVCDGEGGASDPHMVGNIVSRLRRHFMDDVPTGRALFDHAVALRDRAGSGE